MNAENQEPTSRACEHGEAPQAATARGPLAGLRVVEFAGLGPGPFACMLLSDMGADVVRVERAGKKLGDPTDIIGRGRTVVQADLKDADSREEILRLLERADALVEGFRPGVMERLGLGPDEVAARNPRLVYGRMTGWGQEGPLAQAAGHDINYIALTGALHAIGPAGGAPVPPLNLVGDYGGGSLYLVVGILAALYESRRSGRGQVVDAAITDGVNSLMSLFATFALRGAFCEQRGTNELDGGAPYYGVYQTADDKHVSIGPIEPQFFADLCERLGIDPSLRDAQRDRARWPALRAELARVFRSKTRDAWVSALEGSDACFAPVLALGEAPSHPHNAMRGAFVDVEGTRHPAPAPRFSRTMSAIQGPAPSSPQAMHAAIGRWTRQGD
jgi:alpha-methylacyl-CoA racemase